MIGCAGWKDGQSVLWIEQFEGLSAIAGVQKHPLTMDGSANE
jgi:hypothetical protein